MLTPAEQAVIDAAVALLQTHPVTGWSAAEYWALHHAVERYKEGRDG